MRLEIAAFRAFFALAPVIGIASCTADDVLVADQIGDAGTPAMSPNDACGTCASNADCDGASFCAKASCDAPTGCCEVRPLSCDAPNLSQHSCGCDGVTYWNDCMRKQVGIAASTPDQCTNGLRCGPSAMTHCPPEVSCARLVPGPTCAPDAPGTCWALPLDCGPPPGMMQPTDERWLSCEMHPKCLGTCDAIRTELPFHQAPASFMCP